MNATNLYVTTCRLVMHAQPENLETWMELHKLLPYLRQSLSCTVCGKLLIEPYTPTETTCQHHVCQKCLGGKKCLKPTCSWCKDYDMYVDNAQIKLLLQCYRKLCEYIKFTPIYCKLNSIYSNGGQLSLIDMIDEAVGKTNNNKCEEVNPNSKSCDEYEEIDSKENILVDTSSDVLNVSNESVGNDTSKEIIPIDLGIGECKSETEVTPSETLEVDCKQEHFIFPEIAPSPSPSPSHSVDEVNIAISPDPVISSHDDCKEEEFLSPVQTPMPVSQSVIIPSSSLSSLGVVQVSTPPTFSTVTVSSPVSSPSVGNFNLSKSAVPTQSPFIPASHYQYPSQVIPSTLTTHASGSSGSSHPPGTIFSSTKNLVPHSAVGDLQSYPPKHTNTTVNNGSSSMYSVMYADGDSTKITIKRKPPGLEGTKVSPSPTVASTNKSVGIPIVPIEPEISLLEHELIKKPKPKPKPKPKRKGCRCGNATPTPGKLTCCGQRCPCYVEAKACIECRCRGCRNPHRPGGKKVRPVIPQLGNIQIHQVQPVHGRSSGASSITSPTTITTSTSTTNTNLIPTSINPPVTNTTMPQAIRAVQAMHAVQTVHGVNTGVQTMAGGMHQLITLGGGVVQTPLSPVLGVHPVAGFAMKPVTLALTSVPTQLLINDNRSTSASASDNSDVDIDI